MNSLNQVINVSNGTIEEQEDRGKEIFRVGDNYQWVAIMFAF